MEFYRVIERFLEPQNVALISLLFSGPWSPLAVPLCMCPIIVAFKCNNGALEEMLACRIFKSMNLWGKSKRGLALMLFALVLSATCKEKYQRKTRIFFPGRPPKSLGKQAVTSHNYYTHTLSFGRKCFLDSKARNATYIITPAWHKKEINLKVRKLCWATRHMRHQLHILGLHAKIFGGGLILFKMDAKHTDNYTEIFLGNFISNHIVTKSNVLCPRSLGEMQGEVPKKTRIFFLGKTPKILGKEGTNAKKIQEFLTGTLQKEKARNFKAQAKEDQGSKQGGGGLARKLLFGPKRPLSGNFCSSPVALISRCRGISPDPPIGPEKAPISPEKARVLGPDVMQSGFGVNFYFGPANCRKIAGEFLSEI